MTTDKTIELTRIAARDGGARLSFSVKLTEGGESTTQTLTVFSARVTHLPRVGPLTEEELEALILEDAYTKALDMGLRVLGASSLSRAQLMQKLFARGVGRALAAEVAADLWARGFGNERDGALSAARRGLLKLWGDRRILADLRAKGYGTEAIEAARDLLDGEDAVARCARLIAKKYKACYGDESALSRTVAALSRYGYTPREIKAALLIARKK
jgi:SOS response regulatory protein OraA/RecX